MQDSEHRALAMKSNVNLDLDADSASSSGDTYVSKKPCSNDDDASKETGKAEKLLLEGEYKSKAEDSLLDFKSPTKRNKQKSILNKFKIENNLRKKKLMKSKSKSNASNRLSSGCDAGQPTVVSSFFKKPASVPDNAAKGSIPCPLCLKLFKDDASCSVHMKTCARKQNVSVKELLDAKRLQDRQIEERKAKGLLPTPIIPEKKKVFRSKNFCTADDSQFQLVLAMSESLYQAQEVEKLQETALLNGIAPDHVKDLIYEDCKTTLQNFGFTSNKALNNFTLRKSKKKKLVGPTVLQTRSKDEKERVLTERIAFILAGDDVFTQKPEKANDEVFYELGSPAVLRNRCLREIEQKDNRLWDKTKLLGKCDFYVKELRSHFLTHDNQSIDGDGEILSNEACDVQPEAKEDLTRRADNERTTSCDPLGNHELVNDANGQVDFKVNVAFNWGKLLNASIHSDIVILVKNKKYVYAHQLVLYAQCTSILKDLKPNDSHVHPHIRYKICLYETDELSALAFLEFIYCGDIRRNAAVLDSERLRSETKDLARLYGVKHLLLYLGRVDDDKGEGMAKLEVTERPDCKRDPDDGSRKSSGVSNGEDEPSGDVRTITASPDLFGDSEGEDETIYDRRTPENRPALTRDAGPEDEKLFHLSPLEDLCRATTPKVLSPSCDAGVTPLGTDECSGIHDRPTPPRESLLSGGDELVLVAGARQPGIDGITEAVTPPRDQLSSLQDYVTPVKPVYASGWERERVGVDAVEELPRGSDVRKPKASGSDEDLRGLGLRVKSNLSLFIDKIHKENAKGILDTDSDNDSPQFCTKRRNPFLKRDRRDSFTRLFDDDEAKDERHRISMIERDILEGEKRFKAIVNGTPEEEEEEEEEEEAVHFSKHRGTTAHDSAAVHRLEKADNEVEVEVEVEVESSPLSGGTNAETSDSEPGAPPEHPRRKKPRCRAIGGGGGGGGSSGGDSMQARTDNGSARKAVVESISLVSDSDEDNVDGVNEKILDDKTQPLTDKITYDKYLSVSERMNDDVDAVIQRILESCPSPGASPGASPGFEAASSSGAASPKGILNLSPISIASSSPEIFILDEDKPSSSSSSAGAESAERHVSTGFDWPVIGSPARGKVTTMKHRKEESRGHRRPVGSGEPLKEINGLSYSRYSDDITSLITSPIISQSKQKSKTTTEVAKGVKEVKEAKEAKEVEAARSRRGSASMTLLTKTSNKTFKLKSASAANLTKNVKADEFVKCNNMQKSCSFSTPKQCKRPFKDDDDVTPPKDYNSLKTPDLEKELRKFGLKRQRRSKATILLNHIYNETHPVVGSSSRKRASTSNGSSDHDDYDYVDKDKDKDKVEVEVEAFVKRQNVRKKFKSDNTKGKATESNVIDNLYNRSRSMGKEPRNIIARASGGANVNNIKDALVRLIRSKKELYRKVLTYEPLSLEALHSAVKENGYKCKPNELANFLDEQCITFRVQADKRHETTKK